MKHYTFVDYATQAYAALVAVLILFFHNATVHHWAGLVSIHLAGIVFIHGLILLHGWGHPGKGLDFLRHFYPVLLFAWFFGETGWINRMFFTTFLDPVVIRWEQSMFLCQPSVLLMEKFPSLALSELLYASYFSYYIMIGGVGFALFLRNRRHFFHYVSVLCFVFYVCYLLYIILPVIGPPVFFRPIDNYSLPDDVQSLIATNAYPDSVKAGIFFRLMAWIYRVFEAPGAAIPSSHVAVAMCTVYFSFRYLRPIRYVHLVVAILLCIATVYCRYHYAVDVVTGLLTAVLLIPLANRLYFRTNASSS